MSEAKTAGPMNPLIALLGTTQVRCNDGDPLPVRTTLRLEGLAVTDDAARARAVCEVALSPERVRLDVTSPDVLDDDVPFLKYSTIEPGGWFGLSEDFSAAEDVYVTTTEDGVKFGGFVPSPIAARKTLTNAGSHVFEVYNFRQLDDDAGDYNSPGMVQGAKRTLGPGESLRLQWDPIGQRWLVNDGLVSAEILTHDHGLLTHDGATLTSS